MRAPVKNGIEIAPPSLTDEANLEVHVVWGELQVLGRHDGAYDGDAALYKGLYLNMVPPPDIWHELHRLIRIHLAGDLAGATVLLESAAPKPRAGGPHRRRRGQSDGFGRDGKRL